MEKRTLGRTGHQCTVVTFGTAGIGKVSQELADKTIELALQYEVNHADIAPSYGQVMERMAPWMPKLRSKMFLGTKTQKRTKAWAWSDIERIGRRLGLEHLTCSSFTQSLPWRYWIK